MRVVQALVRVSSMRIRYWIAFLGIVVPTALVTVLAVPMKVTVDGIIYISSAKALFTPDLSTDYGWFREPGYPFVLKVIHAISATGMMVEFVQALFLGTSSFIALYAVTKALGATDVSLGQLVLAALLVLNPMYLIYAALVLQQALFTIQLALFGLAVVWALYRPRWLRRWLFIPLLLISYAAAIWSSVGWIYLALVPVGLAIVLMFWKEIRSLFRAAASVVRRVLVIVLAVVATGAMFAVIYVGGIQIYAGWQDFKAPYIAHVTYSTSVIQPLSAVPSVPTPIQMTNLMLSLMHFGATRQYINENDLFFHQQLVKTLPASEYDTAYVAKPYTDYAPGFFSLQDSAAVPHFVYSVLAKPAPILYTATFGGFIVFLFATLARRRWAALIVMMVPWSFLAVYAASDSPIDRYGVPAFPWAAAAVTILASWIVELVRRRRRRASDGAPIGD